jgi:hypothetical protein
MRRWLYVSALSLTMVAGFLFIINFSKSGKAKASGATTEVKAKPQARLRINVIPVGPTEEAMAVVKDEIPTRAAVQKYLRGTNSRMLSFGLLETDAKAGARATPSRYLALFYDYTNNRAIRVEGNYGAAGGEKFSVTDEEPPPNDEEFDDALSVIQQEPTLGAALRAGELKPYRPMPPVLYPERAGARIERTIYVGLGQSDGKGFSNEVVGVNMTRRQLLRYKDGAPPTSRATPDACGISSSSQTTTSNGTAGQYQFTVLDENQNVLWEFLAIRPSASSGNSSERSGIELRDVKYRGKSVLKRIHAPVLNVKYDNDACGPFRDWQYSEGMFQATGTDLPGSNGGLRDCGTNVATTALDSGNDTGNFKGVAFYQQEGEVVLVTEMNAGWYRYICEYRLASDGTIRPRYGYGATANSCVCAAHTHHVYWRMDFDINTPDNNEVLPLSNRGIFNARPYSTEQKLYRNASRPSNWLIRNTVTGDGYMLAQNLNDGHAGPSPDYGRGDVWILKFQGTAAAPTELDDPGSGAANIDAWLTGESLKSDVVIWYAGHYYHNDGGNGIERERSRPDEFTPNFISGTHVQGPDLIPYRW